RSFRTNKPGETLGECEDAVGIAPQENVFAVADGSAQSFYPHLWARILCEEFCRDASVPFHDTAKWIRECQERWQAEMKYFCESGAASEMTKDRLRNGDKGWAAFFGVK